MNVHNKGIVKKEEDEAEEDADDEEADTAKGQCQSREEEGQEADTAKGTRDATDEEWWQRRLEKRRNIIERIKKSSRVRVRGACRRRRERRSTHTRPHRADVQAPMGASDGQVAPGFATAVSTFAPAVGVIALSEYGTASTVSPPPAKQRKISTYFRENDRPQ